jgi:hypothetical protein
MTVQDVKRIALQLANTYWVRYYLCLNYPHDPQAVCISIMNPKNERFSSREKRLLKEMETLGFTWETKYGIRGFHAAVEVPATRFTE